MIDQYTKSQQTMTFKSKNPPISATVEPYRNELSQKEKV